MNIVDKLVNHFLLGKCYKLESNCYRTVFSNSRITWYIDIERTYIDYMLYDTSFYRTSVMFNYLLPKDMTEERLENIILLM